MDILILENQTQDLTSPNCGQFQLYFNKNLFDPDEKSKIVSDKTLNQGILQTIMNKIFSTDVEENEYLLKVLGKNIICKSYYFQEIKNKNG